jgi:phosphate butyryltransferase
MKHLNELLIGTKPSVPYKLVAAGAADLPVILAVNQAYLHNLIQPILVGDYEKIITLCNQNEIDPSAFEIIHETDYFRASQISVKMVKDNNADILMKGMTPSADIMRAVVNKTDGIRESSCLSHFALFESPFYPKLFGVTDAAMNIAPSLESKIAIINNAVAIMKKIGIPNPKTAILTPVETVNPKIQSTVDAAQLKDLNKSGEIPDCIIDGPFALDISVNPEAARHKNIPGEVAGNADLLVVPDLNSGNIFYKSLIYLGGAKLAGVITGAKVPIVLTSRSDSEEAKLLSIAFATKLINNNKI